MNATLSTTRFTSAICEIRTLDDKPVWAGLLKTEEAIFALISRLPAGAYSVYREDPRIDGERDSTPWGQYVNDGLGCVTMDASDWSE
jgi:hypothetical protein